MSCPPRSPEAIWTVSGAHRRGLKSGVRLFTPSIAGPDARVLMGEGKRGKVFQHAARGPGSSDEMPGQRPVSDWREYSSSVEPPTVARTEGGGGRGTGPQGSREDGDRPRVDTPLSGRSCELAAPMDRSPVH